MKCDFGCDKEAIHQFKNGKWCCDTNVNHCENVRLKNSENQPLKNIKQERVVINAICKYCGSIRPTAKSLIAHEATCPKIPTDTEIFLGIKDNLKKKSVRSNEK